MKRREETLLFLRNGCGGEIGERSLVDEELVWDLGGVKGWDVPAAGFIGEMVVNSYSR